MIIFDLDGTLADCEHRRHFVNASKHKNMIRSYDCDDRGLLLRESVEWIDVDTKEKFKPDWDAFYQACDQDEEIYQTVKILKLLRDDIQEIQIWSGRSESVREKTKNWLWDRNLDGLLLKMRHIGDYTPDDQLKEQWLDEAIAQGKTIDAVFDDRPKVIKMWRRRGVFVFNCDQNDEEF